MGWTETPSLSFTARHESTQSDAAIAVLEALETHRAKLEQLFPQAPAHVTVVLHDSALQLALAQPYFPTRPAPHRAGRPALHGRLVQLEGGAHARPRCAAQARRRPRLAAGADAHARAHLHDAGRRLEQPTAATAVPPLDLPELLAPRLARRRRSAVLLWSASAPARGNRSPAARLRSLVSPRPPRCRAARRIAVRPARARARCRAPAWTLRPIPSARRAVAGIGLRDARSPSCASAGARTSTSLRGQSQPSRSELTAADLVAY